MKLTQRRGLRAEWFAQGRADLVAGLVVALAVIPETIAFSIFLGVDPKVGLYGSFCIALVTAIAGGRPGMISAATPATAVLLVTLVKDHGVQYLLAATILAGVLQCLAGALKLGQAMRYVSRSVVTGFVNALAILMAAGQLPELVGVTDETYVLVALGLIILLRLPRLTTAVPPSLICILAVTAVAVASGWELRTVGDMGELPSTLPMFLWPDVPLTLETLAIILPYSIAVAMVGLLTSLMGASVIDNMTETTSDTNRECVGLGAANIATGFVGGMAGCALIGQSIINVKSGGRGRLSSFSAGVFILVLTLFLGPWVSQIPMAALVAIMIVASIDTFNWSSLRNLTAHPPYSSVVMLATMITGLATSNLAIGVAIGVLLSGVFFVAKVASSFHISSALIEGGRKRVYTVEGQLFFGSSAAFLKALSVHEPIDQIEIDFSRAHLWDISSVSALEEAVARFRSTGAAVSLVGLNHPSETIVSALAQRDMIGQTAKPAPAP